MFVQLERKHRFLCFVLEKIQLTRAFVSLCKIKVGASEVRPFVEKTNKAPFLNIVITVFLRGIGKRVHFFFQVRRDTHNPVNIDNKVKRWTTEVMSTLLTTETSRLN